MGQPFPDVTLDVEPSIAMVLAKKMRKRGAGAYQPRTEADVLPLLHGFVRMQEGFEQHRVDNVARLAGGASKEQFRFDVIAPEGRSERLVLRMDPPESVVETSRVREFEALRAFERGIKDLGAL